MARVKAAIISDVLFLVFFPNDDGLLKKYRGVCIKKSTIHKKKMMKKNQVKLEELAEGVMFSAEEVAMMRRESAIAVSMDHTWCGRVRRTTKLRLTFQLQFGEEGKTHTVEVVASMRTGKREVRFDKMATLSAGKWCPLDFKFEVAGHELRVEEIKEDGQYKFGLRVDGLRFNELPGRVLEDEAVGREIFEARAEHGARVDHGKIEKKGKSASSENEKKKAVSVKETKSTTIVAENALVALYQVQLEPGVFGTGILLRNEPSASRRIQVAAVSRAARVPGVVVGDVLVAINGKPLPRGASATELQELVRSNPRYALTAVDALLWHEKKDIAVLKEEEGVPEEKNTEEDDSFFGDDEEKGVAGSELTLNCGNGALGVEWARMVETKAVSAPHVDGLFAAVGIRGQALNLAVKPGDLLVGINHEPLPKDLPSATLLQRFSSAAARGPPTLNLWRCYDPIVLDSILDQCASAKKHALAVNPSVSAHVPRRPRTPTNHNALCC